MLTDVLYCTLERFKSFSNPASLAEAMLFLSR